ncbi:MAG: hypothetical protein QOK07_1549 [Gemmatimonadaceae bacterium]|nr:hypothetical protein [Gemmatimonadaceae bacterium]
MRRVRSASVAVVAALLSTLLAPPSGAQDASRQRAPSVRVYSRNGQVASRYVTPAIEVSEDAYVFAVSLDRDGEIQILHPEYPGISIRILQHKELRLPNFFAGFSDRGRSYDASGRNITYSDSYESGNDSRGTVIALASRAPFNLARVESGGDWNISAIRSLVEHRSPSSAAQALAAYLGAKGEPIGIDYMRFSSAQYHEYYASTPLYSCDLYYGGLAGPSLGFTRLALFNRVEQARRGGQSVAIVGYDYCGLPILAYGPSQSSPLYRPHIPRDSGDTAGGKPIPRGRSAQSGWSNPREAAIGTFPLTRRETPESGEILTSPTPSRRDPREIFNDPRYDALVRESAERGRAPGERNAPPAETPVIGTFPTAREYPRPIVREAPVMVHEPAPSPPPAPPRPAPEVHMKPTADPVPPPAR